MYIYITDSQLLRFQKSEKFNSQKTKQTTYEINKKQT